MLTYLGATGDVLSLVHELGHAVHFVVAGRRRDGLTFEAPVPLNEILPALAELLVCDTMIRRESNPGLQHAWAAKQLETCFETIFLSTVLTDFETRVHQMRDTEGILTETRIRELWTECGKAYYGPAVRLPGRWGLHWMLICRWCWRRAGTAREPCCCSALTINLTFLKYITYYQLVRRHVSSWSAGCRS